VYEPPAATATATSTSPATPRTAPGNVPTTRTLPAGTARLGHLLETLRPRLLAVAGRITRDHDSAADVVQNAFEKVLRKRDQFEGRARVSTWLHRIVANEALMWLRSERRRAARFAPWTDTTEDHVADHRPDPAEHTLRRDEARRLRAALAHLDRSERDVIEGCLLPDRSYRDYGRATGIHPAAAKSRAFRARRRLQAHLAGG